MGVIPAIDLPHLGCQPAMSDRARGLSWFVADIYSNVGRALAQMGRSCQCNFIGFRRLLEPHPKLFLYCGIQYIK